MEEIKKEGATRAARYVEPAICKACQGEEMVLVYVGGSDPDHLYEMQKCGVCNGTGRVKKELVVNIFPFDKL